MIKKGLLALGIGLITSLAWAQPAKKILTFDDILKWNRITEKAISENGKWLVYKSEPWKGDPILHVVEVNGEQKWQFRGGEAPYISPKGKYVIFTLQPLQERVRSWKLAGKIPANEPQSEAVILNTETGTADTIANLHEIVFPKNWNNWVAILHKKNETTSDSLAEQTEKKDFELILKDLTNKETVILQRIKKLAFAPSASQLAFVMSGNENPLNKEGLFMMNLKDRKQTVIFEGKGDFPQITWSEDNKQLAFLSNADSDKDLMDLYLWKNDRCTKVVTSKSKGIPESWELSRNAALSFSPSGKRLFFGIAPKLTPKDSLVLDEEIPQLDVWHWNEPTLHSEQLNSREQDLKKSYKAVYHTDKKNIIQLEQQKHTGFALIQDGDAPYALAWSHMPYAVQIMWEGFPVHNDIFLIDMVSGQSSHIIEDVRATPAVSPAGKYLYWFNAIDTTYNTYELSSGKIRVISTPDQIPTADEINDVPNPPYPYGVAGWLQDDEALLIYDRYDIWRVAPNGSESPENITKNGRKTNTVYRLVTYDFQEADTKGLKEKHAYLLHGHNDQTRYDGYFQFNLQKTDLPEKLKMGPYQLNHPVKAKEADVFVFTEENFVQFPDLQVATNNFATATQISNVNPQQADFKWGTIELYTWYSTDGKKLQGLLAKPANFDRTKKYPMIVNFYEKSSQRLYNHRIPEAHRSTIDYHYYTSNGYVVFNPDVYYDEGYPGEDAVQCVLPGVTALIGEGFIDSDHIAAQGHSWGGYQVAHLATQTNIFAAIESGAPVVNMFSAYGGIRLWTGRNRSFQYEHTQSRIGKNIWEAPLRYLDNSPLFWADKIKTPILIMHNYNDGAVPFSQGVEFFIALRRLQKPAWLLNYNEADHWPTQVRDKYDFQIRMAQFFDHYLKGKPMPRWMQEGIPATQKGRNLGLELMK